MAHEARLAQDVSEEIGVRGLTLPEAATQRLRHHRFDLFRQVCHPGCAQEGLKVDARIEAIVLIPTLAGLVSVEILVQILPKTAGRCRHRMAFVIMRPTLEDDNFSPAQMADQGMADMAGNARSEETG